MPKTIDENFADWEGNVFGFGYGTGERHTLSALKTFFASFGKDASPISYDFQVMECALGPAVAWLLINTLCHADVIEYGTSPRYGWLTTKGQAIAAFVTGHSEDDLVDICTRHGEDYVPCYPDTCNCGPNGYEHGNKCDNPFWAPR